MDAGAGDDSRSSPPGDTRPKTRPNRRGPGRPTKLCAETITAICAGVRQGMPVEHAAVTAGIAPSTFHSWMAVGREVEEGRRDTLALTARERRCVELLLGVRRAEADSLERLRAIATDAATNHRVCKTVVTLTQRLDKDGELRWCESRRCEITEGPNVGAALELLKQRTNEFSLWAQKQQAEQISLEDRRMAERISRNLRTFRHSHGEEEDGDHIPVTGSFEPASDDDNFVEYAPWTRTLLEIPSYGHDDVDVDYSQGLENQ